MRSMQWLWGGFCLGLAIVGTIIAVAITSESGGEADAEPLIPFVILSMIAIWLAGFLVLYGGQWLYRRIRA